MLTNMYCYDYYVPFIVNEGHTDGINAQRRIANRNRTAAALRTKSYLLNRACKSAVIDFAQEVSGHVNGLRDAAKQLDISINRFLETRWFNAFGDIRTWLKTDIACFVAAYNQTCAFALNQDNSPALSGYAARLRLLLSGGTASGPIRRTSGKSMLTVDNQKRLIFHEDRFHALDFDGIARRLDTLQPIVSRTLTETDALLEAPLAVHMNFKDLGCYYTYMFGSAKDNPFHIIDKGTLFDRAI